MYKLLIVEDEKLLRQGLIHMTNWIEYGFIITGEASNGEEALNCIETNPPDIIITDIVMPVMDGVELTKIIKKKYPKIQIIVLSSHSEFEYVRETMRMGAADYLLKQEIDTETLLNSLLKVSKNIRSITPSNIVQEVQDKVISYEQFFLNLLTTNNSEMTSMRAFMEQSLILLSDQDIRFIIYKLSIVKHETPDKVDSNLAFLKNTLLAKMEYLQNLYIFLTTENTLVILFNSSTEDLKIVSELVNKSISDIFINYNISLIALVGPLFSGLQHLRNWYYTTLKISEYLFFYPNEKVLLYDFYMDKSIKLELGYTIINPFIERLKFMELYNKVSELLSQALDGGNYFEIYEVKKNFVEIVNFIVFRLNEMNFDLGELKNTRFNYIQNIEGSDSYVLLMEHFKITLEAFQLCIRSFENGHTSVIIQQVREYILANYSSDISLSSAAEYVHVNKNYLSELFKEQSGENFSNYLIRIRIEKAKKILQSKDIPISELGNQVGYPNSSYFIQLFKKIVGMKPLEYAKMFRKK